ncbi:MAG: response regulator [SAR324 cluster bacterium]|nr:response regulator [SAR324 cluster bacterium]
MTAETTRILIVDDEQLIREVVSLILDKDPYKTHSVADGVYALEAWKKANEANDPYSLIIVDLKMPRMDGRALIEEIRKSDQHISFIVLTGHGSLQDAYTLLNDFRISDFIQKPLENPDQLRFAVKNVLSRMQLELRAEKHAAELENVNAELQKEIFRRKEAEKVLQNSNDQLEERVQQRTAELQQANDLLINSETRMRAIMDSALDAVVILDERGMVETFNPAAEIMFGFAAKEIIGQNIEIILPPFHETKFHQYLQNFIETGEKMMFGEAHEEIAKMKDGTVFPVQIAINEIQIESRRIFAAIIHDITKRKKTEDELNISKEQAEAASQAKSNFLANMSHEIRTPLNAIVGFSQILLNRTKNSSIPPEFLDYLQNIKLSGQRLSEIINNILDLSKIEAGKMNYVEESLNLKQLIQGIYHINKAHALQKNINFVYEIDPQLPTFIKSDRTKLNQILMNLTTNAIKFTSEGKTVTLRAQKTEDFLVLQLQDEGIGISQDQWESIFEAFKQADDTVTRRFGGTGLGLAITKNMVKLLNGRIMVDSVAGSGSVFSVKLPLLPSEESNAASDTSLQDINFAKDNKILVVEDNTMNQNMIESLFDDLGLEVEMAANGKQAIDKLEQLPLPDLILMDLHMPEMDGLAATRFIRQELKHTKIPIVALSADAFTEQQEAAYKAGINDYVTKPIDFNQLFPILKKYLRFELSSPAKNLSLNPALPDSVKQQLQEKLKTLSTIPIFCLDDILEQTEEMLQLTNGFNSDFPALLKEINHAVYDGNEKQFVALVQRALNG